MRQCPENPAKEFKLKTVKKGLDGKMWIVSKRSDGVKVWKKKNNIKGNKGGSNKNKYSTNYSRFNKITGNENLENIFNRGSIISNKNVIPLVTGKKNIVSNLVNHEEGLVRYILDNNLTGYELKNLMLTSKKWYNIILNNLIFLLPKLKDSKEIYNIILRKLLNKDLPKDDKLYINYNKVRNHINSLNKETILKLFSPLLKHNKIPNTISNSQQKNINNILIKLNEKNPEYLLQLFTYGSNIAMLKQGVLVIPYGTIVINDNNYKDYNLNKVLIPDTVKTIGKSAFHGCCILANIHIPDSVNTIEDNAFSECSMLESIIIPNSVISIKDSTFKDCLSLVRIIIPESVTIIGYSALSGCRSLVNISIPDSVRIIEDFAFRGCKSLESIVIPDSVTTIEHNAFASCDSLESIVISKSITTIGNFTFHFCSSLLSITIPNLVISIGKYAFSACTSLASITIGDSVTIIREGAFQSCISLISIIIPNSVNTIEKYAFNDCSKLESMVITDSVTTIGESVFFRCNNLKTIYVSQNRINSNNKIIKESIYNSHLNIRKIKIIPYD